MRLRSTTLAVGVALLLLSACGQPAAQPAPSPVPPTATKAPTATPLPTATPAPTRAPAVAPDANAQTAVRAGLEQARAAKSYRMEMLMRAKGDLGEGLGTGDPTQEVELINMQGEVDGKNNRMVLKGFLAAFFGAQADKGVEFMTVDGKNYVFGPVALLSAPEAKWYELPSQGGSPASSLGSSEMLNTFASDKMDLSDFKVAGTEKLDGRSCTIYAGDKEATIKAFTSTDETGSAALPSPSELEEIDVAELKFWICDDGYFHKMQLQFEGVPQGKTDKVAANVELRLYDFDSNIMIEAPADALPIPTPATP